MPFINRTNRNPSPILRLVIGRHLLTPDEMRLIKEIAITHRRGKADTLDIRFSNSSTVLGDRPEFKYGQAVSVVGGWDDEAVIKGPFRIIGHEYDFPSSGDPVLVLKCSDKSLASMHTQSKNKSYVGSRVNQILEYLANTYRLELDTQIEPEDNITFDDDYSLIQAGETDAQLLSRMAEKLGYIWGVQNNSLYFRRPERLVKKAIKLNWRTGDKSLKDFKPTIKVWGPGKKKVGKKILICQNFLSEDQEIKQLLGEVVTGEKKLEELTPTQIAQVAPKLAKAKELAGGGTWGAVTEKINKVRSKVRDLRKGAQPMQPTTTSDGEIETTEDVPDPTGNIRDRLKDFSKELENSVAAISVDPETGAESLLDSSTLVSEVPEHSEQLRGDAAGATPVRADNIKRRLRKDAQKKLIPVSATMHPTVPSWEWNVDIPVDVQGVGGLCSGLYELTEVLLKYTVTDGLVTELKAKKRAVGGSKATKAKINALAEDSSTEDTPNGSPRKPQEVENDSGPAQRIGVDAETGDEFLVD